MNHAKIAAALHALAEAFEGAIEGVEQVVKKGGKKTVIAAGPDANQVGGTVAPAATVVATAQAPAPVVPTITKDQLNKAVLKVAAKNRDVAEAILDKFGNHAKNTVTLAPEYWQPVFDALEEEIAKQDAAAVQVAQASLV